MDCSFLVSCLSSSPKDFLLCFCLNVLFYMLYLDLGKFFFLSFFFLSDIFSHSRACVCVPEAERDKER